MQKAALGTLYEGRDQGQAMLYAAFGWALYLILVTFADVNWPDGADFKSMISALARFGSIIAFLGAAIAFSHSMPRSLRTPAIITSILAVVGGAIQLSGVMDLMQRVPDIGAFNATFLVAQFVYSLALFPLSYCLRRHPLFPEWLGVGLAIDGLFWILYYIVNLRDFENLFFEILAWGPSMIIETLVGIYFIRAGIKLVKMTQPE
ncbi:hypothetical protein [Corynebacterium sp. H130]|uniref:hypothetical protein n=1 Tax=Corynebacterium sp. H130 TaxID=3133444 RepID=UPI0030B3013C